MRPESLIVTKKQFLFKELFVGTLIYAVALGFLNDYTDLVSSKSFSTIFYSAIVLEILTILTFSLKDRVVQRLRGEHKALIAFSLWLIMFSSKFFFTWAIDAIFKEDININGFFGILIVVATATITNKIAQKTFIILGNRK